MFTGFIGMNSNPLPATDVILKNMVFTGFIGVNSSPLPYVNMCDIFKASISEKMIRLVAKVL